MPKVKNGRIFLSEDQEREKGFEILRLLEGIQLGRALNILEGTKHLLFDCYVLSQETFNQKPVKGKKDVEKK